MATAWQTLEEAALTLGISSRTLHRRLGKGEFPTRLENGRREVLVSIADMPEPAASPTPSADPESPVSHSSDMSESTVLALHEDRIRRTDLAVMAYQQSVTTAAADAR